MNRGWKEAFTAAGILILASIAIYLLSGCVPMRAALQFEHGSSAQDYYDRETTDMAGLCVEATLSRNPGPYSPRSEACLMWELTGEPTYGRDPVGQIRLTQPIWVRQ